MHNMMNVFNATELFALKGFISCHVNFISINCLLKMPDKGSCPPLPERGRDKATCIQNIR